MPHRIPRMPLLRFCSIVIEYNLNLHLLNELRFPEKEAPSKRKLAQPDNVDNVILVKNIFTLVANKLVPVAMD